jgi:hypothetical protein
MAAKPKNKVALVAAGVILGVVAGAMSELSRISPPPKDWILPLPSSVGPSHLSGGEVCRRERVENEEAGLAIQT